ncbi:hypothetical protein AB0I77_43260 [Streptomyces sp. NPDC050619]|uniref:hypothetical protein n=1 Tax=Streptomyces sp. NPDC050619 TaxID=3157214 RepID=UPI0034235C8D
MIEDSEPSKAQRFLSLLQQRAHRYMTAEFAEQFNRLMRAKALEFIGDEYSADLTNEAIEEFSIDHRNSHRRPHDVTLVPAVISELESGIRAHGAEGAHLLPEHPPTLGTLRTGQINAMTIAVPRSNEFVVILEEGLFSLGVMLTHAIAPAYATLGSNGIDTDQTRIAGRLDQDEEAIQLFANMLLSFVQRGRMQEFSFAEEHRHLATNLSYGMWKFIVGHEYGHIVNGDLNGSIRAKWAIVDENVDIVDHSWEREFAADEHGLEMSLLSMTPTDSQNTREGIKMLFATGGGDIFFTVIDIMDRATSLLRTGREGCLTLGSHPPARQRRSAYRRHMNRMLEVDPASGSHSENHAKIFHQFAEYLEVSAEQLWLRTRPHLIAAHKAGVRPAASWRQTSVS